MLWLMLWMLVIWVLILIVLRFLILIIGRGQGPHM